MQAYELWLKNGGTLAPIGQTSREDTSPQATALAQSGIYKAGLIFVAVQVECTEDQIQAGSSAWYPRLKRTVLVEKITEENRA